MKNKIYFLISIKILFTLNVFAQPTRVWGTYYGGTGNSDEGSSMAVDASGNVYIAGRTNSTASISTLGSHQPIFGGGSFDAFLIKFNSAGVRQWATYYGGTGNDAAHSVGVDATGNVYLAGNSNSSSGISTGGSHQSVLGGSDDAFLVKFNSAGVRQWATYYGGASTDDGYSISLDLTGNIYLGGETTSAAAISTGGSHQPTLAGLSDAYLVKFNSGGVRQWATYYGGVATDYGRSVSLDLSSGNVYLLGNTQSTASISTVGSHQPNHSNGGVSFNCFIVQLNSSGVRQWASYYGGNGSDNATSSAVDASGNVYLVGRGTSTVNISTVGSHQPINGGSADAFLVQFNSSGVRQWATYYGGAGDELEFFITIDVAGNVYVAGRTNSTASISTLGSHQPIFVGSYDACLVQFNSIGVRQWGTYYGDVGSSYGNSVAVDASGNIYLLGRTTSTSSISTLASHQPTIGGAGADAFLVQFLGCTAPTQPSSISGLTTTCTNNGAIPYSIAPVVGATSYTWSLPGGWSGTSATNTISATPGASGVFSVTATNACGTSSAQTLSVTVNPLPIISASTSTAQLCIGSSATLTATGGSTYTWNPGGAGNNIVISPTVNTTYTLTGTDLNSCQNSNVITQTVINCSSTGIFSIASVKEDLSIYPNPTHGEFIIKGGKSSDVIHIYNGLGEEVVSTSLSFGEGLRVRLDQPSGIYFIRIGSITKKLIKQ